MSAAARAREPEPLAPWALDAEAVDSDWDGGEDTAAAGDIASSSEPDPATPLARSADDEQLAAWIAAVARQDERALGALYDATCHRVHGLALRIVQRSALAEEVVEDTFWQVWRQAARFDATRGRPLTWLLGMARSRAIDALRRDQRFRHDELPEDDHADAGAAAPPPQDLLDATRGEVALHAALLKIEPRSRQLVALAFFRGWTHEEIAEQQRLPLGTVKSLIRRALLALRQHLQEAGDAR
jgi:RNA polymerase sigma-70 factor (ECF subfamily)